MSGELWSICKLVLITSFSPAARQENYIICRFVAVTDADKADRVAGAWVVGTLSLAVRGAVFNKDLRFLNNPGLNSANGDGIF